jgi:hypothetical protein
MTPEQHRDKAERITRAMEKLKPGDYEMLIEAAMLAGTHWLNVALHRFGLTQPQDDVMHAEYMTGAMRVKLFLVAPGLAEALDEIEQSRPRFVRGDVPDGEVAAARCVERLRQLRAAADMARPFRRAAVAE